MDSPAPVDRTGEADRFEQETIAFHEAVRDGFQALAAAAPARYRVIDSSRPADQVARDVEAAVHTVLAAETGPRVRFVDVIGHEAAIARLRRAAAADRPATAYLLAGPPGVGKRRVARPQQQ